MTWLGIKHLLTQIFYISHRIYTPTQVVYTHVALFDKLSSTSHSLGSKILNRRAGTYVFHDR